MNRLGGTTRVYIRKIPAWDYLKFKHIEALKRDDRIVAVKVIAYAGEDDEYFTFISSESYFELEKWKQYRIKSGEAVTSESWVMRNIWNTKKALSSANFLPLGNPLVIFFHGMKMSFISQKSLMVLT